VAEAGDLLQTPLERDDRGADVTAFLSQHIHRHAPATVERTERVVGRELHVGEKHLVEVGAAGHLAQRPDLDPGGRPSSPPTRISSPMPTFADTRPSEGPPSDTKR
jgi:hypothetical protein